MILIDVSLVALAFSSTLINVWQWIAGKSFAVRKPAPSSPFIPNLSVLKPLKGADSQTEACLRSWFEQDYPGELELLFAVADENDPACEIVHRLAPQFPHRKSKLVIASPILGPNAKISSLCYLFEQARYEHLVLSDADVEISRGFLKHLAEPFQRETALINCFYIFRPFNLAMCVEAVAVNADFWTQVLQGNTLSKMDFALGAVIATTKPWINRIGGFMGLLHDLADDYQLGNRIAKAGGKIELCTEPVTCWNDEQSWREVLTHQLRWARTIRVCRPAPFFLSILSNVTLFSLLALKAAPGVTLLALSLRGLTARANYSRLTGENGWLAFGLAPIKDLIGAVIWGLAFLGNTVTWRGTKFQVNAGGKLTPLA
jgi:ceramide glucosyltransferase